jgi:pyruvate,water dikinase
MWLLRRILRRYQPDLPPDSFSLLSSGSEAVLSAETGRRIWQLSVIARRNDTVRRALTEYPPDEASALLREDSAAADFIAALDSFLSRFGHRAMKEFEFKAPRWEEDPAPVLGMVRNYLTAESNPDEHERRIATRREELIDTIRKGLRGRLFEHTLGVRFRLIRFVADRVRYYVTMRENSRFYWSMSAYILRKKILRLEADYLKRDLLKCKDDIFYLDWDEIEKLGDGTIGWLDVEDRLLERRREHVRLSKITAPRTVGIETAAAKGPVESDGAGGTTLRGQAASPGHYEGPARVILDPALDVELHPGEILVAPYTDPAWTPLFLTAGAAVVEVGSFLSHAGTVAREYGLPCIVDVADCTARIRTGDHLLVDCTAGEVRVLNRAGDEQ